MFNINNGYIGSSMSVRAKACYDNDVKPLSKWSKSDILNYLSNDQIRQIKDNKITLKALKSYLLSYDSWHHSSSYFNKVDFYCIDTDNIEGFNIEDLKAINEDIKKEEKQAKEKALKGYKIALVDYIEWAGTKAHPKAINKQDIALINDKWAYLEFSKKSLNGKYVDIKEVYKQAPKGKAKIIKAIKKYHNL